MLLREVLPAALDLAEVGADKPGSRVTLADVMDYLTDRLPPSSSLVGDRQDAQVYGNRAAAAAVVLLTRGGAAPKGAAPAPKGAAPAGGARPK